MVKPATPRKITAAKTNAPCLYTLHIELRPNEIRPAVWRRIEVDGRISLGKLHHLIQAAFGWSDSHLHHFKLGGKIYSPATADDEGEVNDERKAYLHGLLSSGDTFVYRYDLGDNWEHLISVESVRGELSNDPKGAAWILDGAMACPPEDVGGPEGYNEFLELLRNAPDSEQAQQLREWVDGDFDPQRFDKRLANAAIMRILFNGWGGK